MEISFKHTQNMLGQLQAKVRESDMKRAYEADKYRTAMDSKFKGLISTREQEWEKAWEKREEVITTKDKRMREAEAERNTLREAVARKEAEIE